MSLLLAYLAVVVTALVALQVVELRRQRRLDAPCVTYTAREADGFPGLVNDRNDMGVRVTRMVISGAAPLRLLHTAYTVELVGQDGPVMVAGTYAQAQQALLDAGVDDAAVELTYFTPGGLLPVGNDHIVFALTMPVARRLSRLEAEFTLVASTGERIIKSISALPRVPRLRRAVTVSELELAGPAEPRG